ncbi:MAG TPA: DNA recombination protein RmuC, partial [Spirochaetes bacterium]|nr:DNA recombination protein RmuC [Spirochaetota bacterium]
RGQWGERMAEDVLKLSGFIEGINYQKQMTQESGQRPDFTFFLPQEKIINMDVKFPFNNYLKYSETESEADRNQYKKQFLRDVKDRIKEVITRDYINPKENTVDFVILFIPNEQVYSFIHEHDRDILDDALKKKVIFCSPLTLYAILVVIRQAMDNFHLENTASEILNCLTAFEKQWGEFIASFDKLGKKLEDAQSEFHTLTSTRKNKLEVQLRQVEDLRKQRGIE